MGFVGSAAEIRELFAYDRWASRRILDAVSRLTPEEFDRDLGSSHPSVRATLAHLLAANWVWLERWLGRSPSGLPDAGWDVGTLEALRAKWADVERARRAFVDGLADGDLERPLAYRNTGGEPFEQPLWQTLRHAVNHASYHRGQVVTMLRQLGAEAVSTDLVLFYREVEAAEA
ncbi:MAG: DinB family protein [Gemmatimonadales bacterium]|jgi:uncharacterized damage-inducible protein DinB